MEKRISNCKIENNLTIVKDVLEYLHVNDIHREDKDLSSDIARALHMTELEISKNYSLVQNEIKSEYKQMWESDIKRDSGSHRSSQQRDSVDSLSNSNLRRTRTESEAFVESNSIHNDVEDLVDKANFNVFEFRKQTKNRELVNMAWHIFTKHNMMETFLIKNKTFVEYFSEIQKGYKNTNPYHNKTHACDVLHTTYDWLGKYTWPHNNGVSFFTDFDKMCIFFAAAIHDYKHPGYNNAFLINVEDELAIQYNDSSVLENMHVSQAFAVLNEHNFLANLDPSSRKAFRETVIKLVLATDNKYHFDKVKKLNKGLLAENKVDGQLDYKNIYTEANKLFVMELFLHMCDISNPLKSLELQLEWGLRCVSEFMIQGDKEKKMGLPIVREMYDRDVACYHQSQIGFYEFLVIPLYNSLSLILGDIYGENLKQNLEYNKRNCEAKNLEIRKQTPNYIVPNIFKKYRVEENVEEEDERYLLEYYNHL